MDIYEILTGILNDTVEGPEFRTGDKVIITKGFTDVDFLEGYTAWLPEMEKTIGMIGTIGAYFTEDGSYGVDLLGTIGARGYAYHKKCLKKVIPLCQVYWDEMED